MRSTPRRARFGFVALVAVFGLLLVACGDSDDDSSSDTTAGSGITSLDDLAGKTIGVQSDTTGETYANDHKPEGATVKSYGQTDELFAALASDQIQGILQDFPINAYRATQQKTVKVVQTFKTDEQYGFVVKTGNTALLGAINSGLAGARTDGTYDELYKKYFGTTPPAVADEGSGSDTAGEISTVKSGTLTMCSDTPYAPMEFEGDGPSGFTGFDVELMEAIAKSMDLKLAVVDVDFDGILGNLASGKCDVVGSSVTITDEREQQADFSDPYFDANQSLLVKVG